MGVLPNSLIKNSRLALLRENAQWVGQDVSIPNGYQSAKQAYVPSFKESSKMAWRIFGDSYSSFSILGIGNLNTIFVGETSVTLSPEMGASLSATLYGEGDMLVSARGIGSMNTTMDAGVRPSAFDIAQEVWQSQKTAYNATGTMGNALNLASSGGIDYAALGLAVWDVLTTDMDLAGSAGEKLKSLLTTGKFIALKD